MTNHACWCARWTIWFKYNSHANKHGNSWVSESLESYSQIIQCQILFFLPHKQAPGHGPLGSPSSAEGEGTVIFSVYHPSSSAIRGSRGLRPRRILLQTQTWPVKASVFDPASTCASLWFFVVWWGGGLKKKKHLQRDLIASSPFLTFLLLLFLPPPPFSHYTHGWAGTRFSAFMQPHLRAPSPLPFIPATTKNKCLIFSTTWNISSGENTLTQKIIYRTIKNCDLEWDVQCSLKTTFLRPHHWANFFEKRLFNKTQETSCSHFPTARFENSSQIRGIRSALWYLSWWSACARHHPRSEAERRKKKKTLLN